MLRCLGVVLVLCVAVLGACSPAQDRGLSDEDRSAIEEMTRAWVGAHGSRDWDTLATMYTEEAVLMPPFARIVQGRSTIREWFENNEEYTSIDVTILEIDGYEDLAYVRGTSRVTLSPPGQEPVSYVGKYLDIRRREADGSWKVSVDMFSLDTPPE